MPWGRCFWGGSKGQVCTWQGRAAARANVACHAVARPAVGTALVATGACARGRAARGKGWWHEHKATHRLGRAGRLVLLGGAFPRTRLHSSVKQSCRGRMVHNTEREQACGRAPRQASGAVPAGVGCRRILAGGLSRLDRGPQARGESLRALALRYQMVVQVGTRRPLLVTRAPLRGGAAARAPLARGRPGSGRRKQHARRARASRRAPNKVRITVVKGPDHT